MPHFHDLIGLLRKNKYEIFLKNRRLITSIESGWLEDIVTAQTVRKTSGLNEFDSLPYPYLEPEVPFLGELELFAILNDLMDSYVNKSDKERELERLSREGKIPTRYYPTSDGSRFNKIRQELEKEGFEFAGGYRTSPNPRSHCYIYDRFYEVPSLYAGLSPVSDFQKHLEEEIRNGRFKGKTIAVVDAYYDGKESARDEAIWVFERKRKRGDEGFILCGG